MIPQGFVQELLNRVDIVEVVDRQVPLKRAGANYVACCPFHSEKTPSFTVSATKQFYHCFGCGAHGTAIGFLMEHGGLSFPDAVKDLAARVGMQVPEDRSPPRSSRATGLQELLFEATRYYRDQLKHSDRAIAYLKRRGVTGEAAARFGLGYAPPGWQNLAAAFRDYQDRALVEAGLVIQGDDGKRYDRFRDRIMLPILNQRGQVIGFGARILDQGEPKYLNSPETPVFEKGRELYGLYQARQAIRENGSVIVVEGYMDVVALAQHGIGYAVATLGTATTSQQVQILLRNSDQVIFCFDGDAAGRRAAWRALENSLAHLADGKQVSFLFLPEGEDPDSYVRRLGREGFERLLKEAQPLSTFLVAELTRRADLGSEEGRAKVLQEARPLITRIAAPALGLLVRKRLAEVAGVTLAELNSLFKIKGVTDSPRGRPAASPGRGQSLYRRVLQCLLMDPELARESVPMLPGEAVPEARLISQLIEFVSKSQAPVSTAAVIQRFSGSPFDPLMAEVERDVAPLGPDFNSEAELLGALAKLREDHDRQLRKQERELLESKGLETLTPEERSRYLSLLQSVARTASNE